jgi:hypothetical protein
VVGWHRQIQISKAHYRPLRFNMMPGMLGGRMNFDAKEALRASVPLVGERVPFFQDSGAIALVVGPVTRSHVGARRLGQHDSKQHNVNQTSLRHSPAPPR